MAKKILINMDLQQNEIQNVSKVTTNALKFTDGNEGANKVMQSDAAGNVSWADAAAGNFAGLSDTDISGLATGDLIIYDGTSKFKNKPLAGDLTIDAAGAATIGAGKVTFANLKTTAYSTDLSTSAGNNQLVRADAAKAYTDAAIATADAFVLKGALDCSGNPDYPAGEAGHSYVVSVAGKIGGAAGESVEVGDIVLCTADGTASGDQATVGSSWTVMQGNSDASGINTALGINAGDSDMGTYTGTIISDNVSAKAGLQELESDLEALQTASGLTAGDVNNGTFTGTTIADNVTTKAALQALETAVETKPTKYIETFGDGAATSYTINHALNDADVIAQVRDASSNDVIECDIVMTDANNVTVSFATAPATNDCKIVVIG